jgi:hypothetical protein
MLRSQPISQLSRYLGLGLIAGSVLGLQVTFTRIFSITIWYHFTYLIVGVALLGGGAAGTYLAIVQWERAKIARRLSRITLAFSLSILICLAVITLVRFDPLGNFNRLPLTVIGLAAYFVALFATFFLGGLIVAGVFSVWAAEAHRLYFADLLGASISTLGVVFLVQTFGGPGALVLIAFLALIAAYIFSIQAPVDSAVSTPPSQNRALLLAVGAVEIALFVLVAFISPLQVPAPESKELGRVMSAFSIDRPEYTRWNPVARVDVLPPIEVVEPMIVGGISPVYLATLDENSDPYELRVVTLDGTSMTGLYRFDDLGKFEFLRNTVIAAPYIVSPENPRTLNIGVGGGLDILLAKLYNASSITAIDLNSDLVSILQSGNYADYAGNLIDGQNVTLETAEGRSFLIRAQDSYDIIQGIGLDNFAALSGGAYVLSESYIYTVEALGEAFDRLTPQGIYSWTRGVNQPPREMLRLTGLAAEALRRRDIDNIPQHIAIVANNTGETATLLVSRAGFTEDQVRSLRDWAAENQFTLFHDPLERLDTLYADYLHAPDPRAFEAAYPFNIFPVTDDNPFFYNYFRWTNLVFDFEGNEDVNTRLPVGNLILLAMLAFALLTAAAFIIIPLLRYRRGGLQTPQALPALAYFSLLGLAYIFVEIVLIQRFTLFIGYPTHAITTTIFSMLFFSAVGSLVGRGWMKDGGRLRLLLLALSVTIVLYIIALPYIFERLLLLSDTLRILFSIVMIAPVAFLMGMPFPTGLRQLSIQAQEIIPWAWAMNGVFSVIGSVLVIIISIASNFTTALAVAAIFYGTAAIFSSSLWQARLAPQSST